LKKRTKKLLFSGGAGGDHAGQDVRETDKSFLVLFFKKELLPCFFGVSVAAGYNSYLALHAGARFCMAPLSRSKGRIRMTYQRTLKRIAWAALAAGVPALAQAALAPAGSRYSLNVTTSFEKPFIDCWTFSTNGTFIHSPSLHNFPYQLDNLNTEANDWQAIWQGRVSIAFSGATSGNALSGNAVDALGRTYSITGTLVQSCPNAIGAKGGWPVRR
jgi:hypothetical protein